MGRADIQCHIDDTVGIALCHENGRIASRLREGATVPCERQCVLADGAVNIRADIGPYEQVDNDRAVAAVPVCERDLVCAGSLEHHFCNRIGKLVFNDGVEKVGGVVGDGDRHGREVIERVALALLPAG